MTSRSDISRRLRGSWRQRERSATQYRGLARDQNGFALLSEEILYERQGSGATHRKRRNDVRVLTSACKLEHGAFVEPPSAFMAATRAWAVA